MSIPYGNHMERQHFRTTSESAKRVERGGTELPSAPLFQPGFLQFANANLIDIRMDGECYTLRFNVVSTRRFNFYAVTCSLGVPIPTRKTDPLSTYGDCRLASANPVGPFNYIDSLSAMRNIRRVFRTREWNTVEKRGVGK